MFDIDKFLTALVPMNDTRINTMKADIIETATTYEVKLDVPGFTKDEISIEIKDGSLIVSANKDINEDDGTIRRERHTSLNREFYLDGKVDIDSIVAKLDNGVLTIKGDKSKDHQPKTIEIK